MIEFGENAKLAIPTSWPAALAVGVIARAIETTTNSASAVTPINDAKSILESSRLGFKTLLSICSTPVSEYKQGASQ